MIAGSGAIQCGDITNTPRKASPLSCVFAYARKAGPVVPGSTANMGDPCETNKVDKTGVELMPI
jgi:hypothetical protein